MTMNSRERVLTTFDLAEPDRVPIDYMANPAIDLKLKDHYGLAASDDEGLHQALGTDFRGIWIPYTGPRLHPEIPDRKVDPEWGVRRTYIEHGAGGYWECCDFPLRDADEETVADWPMPSPDDYDYSLVPEFCKQYEDKAIYVGDPGLGDILNSSGTLFSPEAVYMNALIQDPAWSLYADRKVDIQLEHARRRIEAADGRVDFMWIGEDLGTQNGPLISLDVFRASIRPRLQKFVDLAKSFDLPVMIHSCGSSSWAFGDFIEMGINGVDTLQPEATNMSPAYLKQNFGDKLAFHGCISTAGPLSFGTPEEVEAEVRATLEIMKPGGGYCLAPTHSIQDNSPLENVLRLYEVARNAGKY
ncbi:MAG: uroporphyrinogen decarboxylase family protein [Candidatus Sumerlaeota bacterium]